MMLWAYASEEDRRILTPSQLVSRWTRGSVRGVARGFNQVTDFMVTDTWDSVKKRRL